MSADARALHLFERYLDMPERARARALDALRETDPQAHAILASMLNAHARPHPLDDIPPLALLDRPADDAGARVGTRLDHWQIDRVIATGGMGNVYEAHREDGQYRQRAALKCIRGDLLSPALVAAFRSERQHLAQLEHPHIAPLLDGGVDEAGTPWFAMRYVDGEPIDRWSDRHGLSLEARVDLMLQACDALAYAHGLGIIHRDIKPSNLLVTPKAQVQVLDFGLSYTGAPGEVPPLAVSAGYTAPEVVRGDAPGPAADIYSLGTVLARLLCGLPPPRLPLAQALRATPSPPRLSRLAEDASPDAAAQRGLADTIALARRLAGDLDAIVARCIDPDPARRYASVAALGDDLRRWRTRRPVRARDGGWLYRTGRFLHRHRLAAGFAGVALLSVAAAVGIGAWHAHRAGDQARASRAVAALFERTLGSATLSGLGETPYSSADLLRATEAQLRAQDLHDHPGVLALGLDVLARNQVVIGNYRHATALADEAARLYARAGESAAAPRATQAALLNLQARHVQAQRVAEDALADLPHDAENRRLRITLMTEVARSLWARGQRDRARRELDTALRLAAEERDPSYRIELLSVRGYWASRLHQSDAAAADLDEAIALATPGHPLLADTARLQRASVYQQQENLAPALPIVQDVLARRQRTLGDDHPDTGRAWAALANIQIGLNQLQAATASLATAERILTAAYGTDHPLQAELAARSAFIGMRRGDPALYEASVDRMRDALRDIRRFYGPTNDSVLRIQAWLGSGLLYTVRAEGVDVAASRDEGITLLRDLAAISRRDQFPVPYALVNLARALADRGKPGDIEEANALLDQVEADIDRFFGPRYRALLGVRETRALLRYLEGDDAGADAILTALTPQIAEQMPHPNAQAVMCRTKLLHAAVASRLGETTRARSLLEQLREAAGAKTGQRVPPACGPQARRALQELARTGRYTWRLI